MISNLVAAASTGEAGYPAAPFSPDRRFAEYPFPDCSEAGNLVYAGVRELLRGLRMDEPGFRSPAWNPFGGIIRPGSRVLIKPNLVRHYHPYGFDPRSIVTHASVVRAVCDYVWIALERRGELVIGDAPLQSCSFEDVVRLAELDKLVEYYRGQQLDVKLRDLRLVRAMAQTNSIYGKVLLQEQCDGDPLGYTQVDLGELSLHAHRGVDSGRFRVTCYDPRRMQSHHNPGKHAYIVANSLLEADVVINLPKMKTHHKAGITGALKNFVGINGHKDCLPHHVKGSAGSGGDEYRAPARLKELDSWLVDQQQISSRTLTKKAVAVAHTVLHAAHMAAGSESYWEGSWYGNDTISRTTVDLNRIVLYADKDGSLRREPQREVFNLIDGVIAGELDGPLAPTPKHAGVLLAGWHPVATDMAMARLMGFRCGAINTLRHALSREHPLPLLDFPPEDIEIHSSDPRWRGIEIDVPGDSLEFRPHRGWRGHLEL